MTQPHRWRRMIAGVFSAVLAFSSVVSVLPSNVAAATSKPLTISEISWFGASETDEWIELTNTSGADLDLATTPFTLRFGTQPTDPTITVGGLGAPVIPADGSVVVRNAGATVLAIGNPGLIVFEPTTAMPALADSSLSLDLIDGTSTVIDSAFAMRPGNTTAGYAPSLERISLTASGTADTNWAASKVVGRNFIGSSTNVLGTPGTPTVVIPAAQGVTFTPVARANTADEVSFVTVNVAATIDLSVTTVTLLTRNLDTGITSTDILPVSGTTTAYSYDVSLQPGRYQFGIILVKGADRLPAVWFPVAGAEDGAFTVVPQVSAVVSPVVDAVAASTVLPTVSLSGSSPFGVTYERILVLRNGVLAGVVTPLPTGQFSTVVALTPNSSNLLEVVGVSSGVYTAPVSRNILHDDVALALSAPTTEVVASAPGNQDAVRGLVGAAEPMALVQVSNDPTFASVLGFATAKADGSFGPIQIGDNAYATVYARQTDVLGNVSVITAFANPVSFTLPTTFTFGLTSATTSEAVLGWSSLSGVVRYELFVKTGTAAYGVPRVICTVGTVCPTSATVLGLSADTAYTVGLVAVDAAGNRSALREIAVRTAAPAVVTPVAPVVQPAVVTEVPVVTQVAATPAPVRRVIPAPTPVATPTPTPSATPEAGEVQSATTEAGTNWAPWIILAIILVVALAAALGYFYWFGGEAGEAALLAANKRGQESASKPSDSKSANDSTKKNDTPPDKRW